MSRTHVLHRKRWWWITNCYCMNFTNFHNYEKLSQKLMKVSVLKIGKKPIAYHFLVDSVQNVYMLNLLNLVCCRFHNTGLIIEDQSIDWSSDSYQYLCARYIWNLLLTQIISQKLSLNKSWIVRFTFIFYYQGVRSVHKKNRRNLFYWS